ncbi:hypothetical protein KR059_004047, partial [Drosophila kikkawai]
IQRPSDPSKMRGCCGRELGREFWDGGHDGGNNSSSLISGSGEVRLKAVAAHARVMILWPFYN